MWPQQTVHLRPLGVGERIDAAIKIVRASFLTLARAALVVAVPAAALLAAVSASLVSTGQNLLATNGSGLTGDQNTLLGGYAITVVVALLVGAFVTAACFALSATPTWASVPPGEMRSDSDGRNSILSCGSKCSSFSLSFSVVPRSQ